MMTYDEGDKGEYTFAEAKRDVARLSKEIKKVEAERNELGLMLATYKTVAELWERLAKSALKKGKQP